MKRKASGEQLPHKKPKLISKTCNYCTLPISVLFWDNPISCIQCHTPREQLFVSFMDSITHHLPYLPVELWRYIFLMIENTTAKKVITRHISPHSFFTKGKVHEVGQIGELFISIIEEIGFGGPFDEVVNYLSHILLCTSIRLTLCADDMLPPWSEGDRDYNLFPLTLSEKGQDYLDRLCRISDISTLLPGLIERFSNFLLFAEWEYRYTALMAISMIATGCKIHLNIEMLMTKILPLFEDPHPIVVWAAINVVGQFSSDFEKTFQSCYNHSVLPILLKILSDLSSPRLQAHASSALINFCEHSKFRYIEPYMKEILSVLLKIIKNSSNKMIMKHVTAVSAFASCSKTKFIDYYDDFIPVLKDRLNSNSDDKVLKEHIVSCICLIGYAVGKDKFLPDTHDVICHLKDTHHADGDNMNKYTYFIQSWNRILSVIDVQIVPYLPDIMEKLIPIVQNVGNFENSVVISEDEIPIGWGAFYFMGNRGLVHVDSFEVKASACIFLYCIAKDLNDYIFEYVDKLIILLRSLLNYICHIDVPTYAAFTLPYLLRAAKNYYNGETEERNVNKFMLLWEATLESIVQGVLANTLDTIPFMIPTLVDCLKVRGMYFFEPERLKLFNEITLPSLVDFVVQHKNTQYMVLIIEMMQKVIKYHPDTFVSNFDYGYLKTLLEASNCEQVLAVSLFHFIVWYTGDKNYTDFIYPFLIKHRSSEILDLQVVCCSALSVLGTSQSGDKN
eukprot:TRINITY_DN378_c0_g1_i2.p1 TRINITY_DN378_c0_g1~~TRINITY_DN378_c0_g1_i2.p1  ORF type:complete len:732 (-),score=70.88 TRINITY_DN378_c0_g1_i2:590-2785(-)